MARPKGTRPRIQVTVSERDKEFLEHLAEVEQTSISQIVAGWVAQHARMLRAAEANAHAAELMEKFFGAVVQDLKDRPVDDEEAAVLSALGDVFGPGENQRRSSITGAGVSKMKHGGVD